MIRLILRAIGYIGLLILSLITSNYFFASSNIALISIFVFGAITGEYIVNTFWPRPENKNNKSIFRKIWLGVIFVAILCSGGILIDKAMSVRHKSKMSMDIKENFSYTLGESKNTKALAVNKHGNIIAVSSGLLAKTEWSRQDIINQPVNKLVLNFNREDFNKRIKDYNEVWIMQENEQVVFNKKDGTNIKLPMTIVMCKLSNDKLLYDDDVLVIMLTEDKE